ncbi:hypothetical protein HHK36_015645 [Tetracentron sinense]|uniref:Phosphate transporter n=1 Tax=Tetracentron sinense TaxID=13715 RepID=A0A834Z5B7_TETSI|nr:hypothetical protein HHK36_015645 [Tetracentron sinense]
MVSSTPIKNPQGIPRILVISFSSFAEAEGGKREVTESKQHQENEKSDELPGMAQAFHISSSTASAISICLAFAALSIPFSMKSLMGQGLGLKTKFLSYATLLFGFYMACNTGANDVANAMGDFCGVWCSESSPGGQGYVALCRVAFFSAAAGTWLQIASYYGLPVSTTHCIVGAMIGFGLVYGGVGAVFWSSLARVTSSWVISPVLGAAVSFLVYKGIRRCSNPGQAAAAAPIVVFVGVTGISFAAFPLSKNLPLALAQALACGTAGAVLVSRVIWKQLGHLLKSDSSQLKPKEDTSHNKNVGFLSDIAGPSGTQLEIVYGVFGYMQVLSACFMSFAHGGNDVSNAIGPLAAALSLLQGSASRAEIIIPTDDLAWGGFGIVEGLMMWGYRLGLPISATHTPVGAVMGVGLARGLNSVRAETVKEVVASWAVTIPIGAFFAVLYTWIFTKAFDDEEEDILMCFYSRLVLSLLSDLLFDITYADADSLVRNRCQILLAPETGHD